MVKAVYRPWNVPRIATGFAPRAEIVLPGCSQANPSPDGELDEKNQRVGQLGGVIGDREDLEVCYSGSW